jgi:hypothetical protein
VKEPRHLALAIEALTQENIELRERLASLTSENLQLSERVAHLEVAVGWGQEIARANMDVTHAQHVRIVKLEDDNRKLRETIRLLQQQEAA